MKLRKNSLRAATLLLACGLGAPACGGAPQVANETRAPEEAAPGTLVARVVGHPRDIRYFINGKHFKPNTEIEWWRDARLEVQLAPGSYEIKAEYVVRAFAGDGEKYRIATSEPVVVHPGRVTSLYANLEKDYRGVPRLKTAMFNILNPTRSTQPEESPDQPDPRLHEDTLQQKSTSASPVLRVVGNTASVEPGQTAEAKPLAGNSIRVHGTAATVITSDDVERSVESDEHSTITIRKSAVSQRPKSPSDGTRRTDATVKSVEIHGTAVEYRSGPSPTRVVPEGGNAIQIRGSRMQQTSEAPTPTAAALGSKPPEDIAVRGTQVSRTTAGPTADRPGPEAPVETLEIRKTRVQRSVAPVTPPSP